MTSDTAQVTDSQRALGAFYTPPDVADALTRWALRDAVGPVLDPSYGICRFLDAAAAVLAERGVADAFRLIHGIDIDVDATSPTRNALIRRGAQESQFTHRDFFECSPTPTFAAVLGNPPYIRHQWQRPESKAAVNKALGEAGVALSGLASLWAPFTVHADRFVAPSGRMTLVLPGSALQADYAEDLWLHFAARYERVTLVRVGERIFPDALEETVLLLADSRRDGSPAAPVMVREFAGFEEVRSALATDPQLGKQRDRAREVHRVRRSTSSQRLIGTALSHPAAHRLDAVASTRLGSVTGANQFFVRRASDPLLDALAPHEMSPVVARSRWLTGSLWTRPDDDEQTAADRPSRLMHLDPRAKLSNELLTAIHQAEAEGLHLRSHCRRRAPWWSVPRPTPPDAFLPYMSGEPKGIVLNESEAGCINGVHALRWQPGVNGADFIVSSWSSLWALSLEQISRHYGGGVLKLEPGKAPVLPVVRLVGRKHLERLDSILRSEGGDRAREFADEAVLRGVLRLSASDTASLARQAKELRARRAPSLRVL